MRQWTSYSLEPGGGHVGYFWRGERAVVLDYIGPRSSRLTVATVARVLSPRGVVWVHAAALEAL